jgi:hypothetical protein
MTLKKMPLSLHSIATGIEQNPHCFCLMDNSNRYNLEIAKDAFGVIYEVTHCISAM